MGKALLTTITLFVFFTTGERNESPIIWMSGQAYAKAVMQEVTKKSRNPLSIHRLPKVCEEQMILLAQNHIRNEGDYYNIVFKKIEDLSSFWWLFGSFHDMWQIERDGTEWIIWLGDIGSGRTIDFPLVLKKNSAEEYILYGMAYIKEALCTRSGSISITYDIEGNDLLIHCGNKGIKLAMKEL